MDIGYFNISASSGTGETTIQVKPLSKNTGEEPRSTNIKITTILGKTQIIKLTQKSTGEPPTYVFKASDEYLLDSNDSSKGYYIRLTSKEAQVLNIGLVSYKESSGIQTPVELVVYTHSDWINLDTTTNLITVDENTGSDREGSIIVGQPRGGDSPYFTIKIYQPGPPKTWEGSWKFINNASSSANNSNNNYIASFQVILSDKAGSGRTLTLGGGGGLAPNGGYREGTVSLYVEDLLLEWVISDITINSSTKNDIAYEQSPNPWKLENGVLTITVTGW